MLVHVLEGLDPNRRHIRSTIVLGAGALHQGPPPASAQLARAGDHLVRAFDRFDGDHIAITDGERLPDVESEQLGEERPHELDVRALVRAGLGRGHHAWFGELVHNRESRVDEGDAAGVELVGDHPQYGVRSAVVPQVLVPRDGRGDIGDIPHQLPSLMHELGLIHFTHHDGMMHAPSA